MGLITDFFSSFSRSGAQVTRDIQSVAQRGRVIRRPSAVRPRTRRAAIHRVKRRVVSAVSQLSRSKKVQFINTEARKIDLAIKRESKARIPSLHDIQMAGYRYGQKNPEAARLIYGSGNFGAGVVRKAIPKDIGVPAGQAMFAFSDGAIHGIRNDPVKTLAFVALPGAVGAVVKGAKYIPVASKIVKSEKAMKAAAYGFDIVYSHNVYTRVNAPVVSHYKDGPVVSETSRTMPDGSIQITQTIKQIPVMRKPNTNEKADRLGYIFSTEAGPMVFGAMGIQKVSKVRFKELSKKGVVTTKKTVKKLKKPGEIKKHLKEQVETAKMVPTKIKKPLEKIKKIEIKKIPLQLKSKILKREQQIKTHSVKINALIKQHKLRLKQKITRAERKKLNQQLKQLDALLSKSKADETWKVAEARLLKQKGKTIKQLEKDTLAWKTKQDDIWKALEKNEKWITTSLKPKITRVSKIKVTLKAKILRREQQIKTLTVKIKALIKQNRIKLTKKITRAERKRIKAQVEQLDTLLTHSQKLERWNVEEARLLRQKGKTVKQLEKDTLKWRAEQDATWKALEKHETWINKGLKTKVTPTQRIKTQLKSKILKREQQIKALTVKLKALKQRLTASYNKLSLKDRKRKKILYKQRMNQLKTLVNQSWKLEKWKVDESKLIEMPKPKSQAVFDKVDKNIKSLDIKTQKEVEWIEVNAPKNGKLLMKEEVVKRALQEKIVAKRKASEAKSRREAGVVSGNQILITKTEMVSVGKKSQKIDIVAERKKANALMDQLVEAQKKAQAEAGILNKLKIEAKSIYKVKPRTVNEAKIKNKQLHKINGKIKTKRKAILIYKQKMKSIGKRLKHTQKIYWILLQKGKQIPESRFKQFIITIPLQINKTIEDNARIITYIDKIIQVPIQKPVQIIKPVSRITPILKPPKKVIEVVKPVPKLLIPIKAPAKKKKKRKKKGVKEAFIVNPVPSLRAFLGD